MHMGRHLLIGDTIVAELLGEVLQVGRVRILSRLQILRVLVKDAHLLHRLMAVLLLRLASLILSHSRVNHVVQVALERL